MSRIPISGEKIIIFLIFLRIYPHMIVVAILNSFTVYPTFIRSFLFPFTFFYAILIYNLERVYLYSMKYYIKTFYSLPVCIFLLFTGLFFSPLEVYLANYNEFIFSLPQIWWILFLVSLIPAILLSLFFALLPKAWYFFFNFFSFAFGFCFWFQAMALNGKLSSFTGDSVVFSPSLMLSNLLIWISIICLICFLFSFFLKKTGSEKIMSVLSGTATAFIIIQSVGLIPAILSRPDDNTLKTSYFSSEGEFELSSGTNLIYFVLDTCDEYFMSAALNEYPDLLDNFDGFTYFPNNTSLYSRSFPSIPYLLTGEKCYFNVPYVDYIENAYINSTFLKNLVATDADICIYTEPYYTGSTAEEYIRNFHLYDMKNMIRPFNLVRQMLHLSGYRGMPYLFKDRFFYEAEYVNQIALALPSDTAVYEDDEAFYQSMHSQGLHLSDEYSKAFRFYHMWGPHPGHRINENLVTDWNASYSQATAGCFRIIQEYISELKRLGIYDSSTIIITADHGAQNDSEDLLLHQRVCSLLLVKPSGRGPGTEFQISNAPISHTDLFGTVIEALGGNTTVYGPTVWEISEDSVRDRYFYHTALYSDIDGEIALREYLISGNALDFSNWHLTGNYWDIDYSQRAVSTHRLNDIL